MLHLGEALDHTNHKVTTSIVDCLLRSSDFVLQFATWSYWKLKEGHGITAARSQTLQCPLPPWRVLPYDSQHVSSPPLHYLGEVTYLSCLIKSPSTLSSSQLCNVTGRGKLLTVVILLWNTSWVAGARSNLWRSRLTEMDHEKLLLLLLLLLLLICPLRMVCNAENRGFKSRKIGPPTHAHRRGRSLHLH